MLLSLLWVSYKIFIIVRLPKRVWGVLFFYVLLYVYWFLFFISLFIYLSSYIKTFTFMFFPGFTRTEYEVT